MPERPTSVPAPRARDWDRYVAEYHDARPGITEDVLADARDDRGRSPYDWLVEAVPPESTTVVDLACGSGPAGRLVRARRVVGVDRSAGELGRAQDSAPGGLLVRARAHALPLAASSVDAVVSSMALMLLSPLEAVLAEVARLLRPGGVFAATVPVRSASAGPAPALPFSEILDALGQGPIDYPEPLTGCTPGGRLSASGLTLRSDRLGVFTRTGAGARRRRDDGPLVLRPGRGPGPRRRCGDGPTGPRSGGTGRGGLPDPQAGGTAVSTATTTRSGAVVAARI